MYSYKFITFMKKEQGVTMTTKLKLVDASNTDENVKHPLQFLHG